MTKQSIRKRRANTFSQTDRLARLINERLSYMKDVAAYKWVNQLHIEDIEREKIVVRSCMEKAQSYQLDPISCRAFCEQQIIVAKNIEQFWFDHWQQNGFDKRYMFRDLKTEVRPALLRIGEEILSTIQKMMSVGKTIDTISAESPIFLGRLNTIGLTTEDKLLLYQSVTNIKVLGAPAPSC